MPKAENEKIPFKKKTGNVDVPGRLRALDKTQRHAVLATDSGEQPYTSLVAFALTPDMRSILFATPKKTKKYRNIISNANAALLIDNRSNTSSGYIEAEAITILGRAVPVRKSRKRNELSRVFTQKHPPLAQFVEAASTALICVTIEKIVHAGKFQTITEWLNERK